MHKLVKEFLERADRVHLRTTGGKKNWETRKYTKSNDKARSNGK